MPKISWQKIYNAYFVPFWIILPFILWVLILRGFLSLRLVPCGDAVSYLEHTKFFIENLARGKLPLWDPLWYHGVPNDFFLRRIGIFNPFYSIIVFLESLGLPYALASVCFWLCYYWSGMIAFYLLSKRLFNDRLIAYAGYLILLFSASTVRLINSYEMIITIPIIWFFYFLIAFSQTPCRLFFLGMILFFVILASTYIPFYFSVFFMLFLLFFFLFYYRHVPILIQRYAGFFKVNKILVILSVVFVLFSLVPGALFLHNAVKQQIILPLRHGDSSSKMAFTVPYIESQWGIVEELMDSSCFRELKPQGSLNVYVPFFVFIVFALGLFCRITRLAVFMLVCGLVLICIFLPYGPPFYHFLYQHIFFFKIFRNTHFYIWFVLVPLFILFVLEHWRMFENSLLEPRRRNKYYLFYALIVHGLAFVYLWSTGEDRIGDCLMLIFSYLFWSLTILRRFPSETWKFALLAVAILVQPVEIYNSFFSFSNRPVCRSTGIYDTAFDRLPFDDSIDAADKIPSGKGVLYYVTMSYNIFYQNISNAALVKYLKNKFILVDHLQLIDRSRIDFVFLEKHFLQEDNLAFVFKDERDVLKINSNDPSPPAKMQGITGEHSGFKVLSFDANDLKLAVEIPYEKFLIYNDNYDPSWRATVNGQEVHVTQANVAFKGIWLVAGKNIIEFHYGSWWQYAMNFILLAASFMVLGGIIGLGLMRKYETY